ncbi:MAG: hypothetical protein A2Y74_08890 [Actinobacteria bacterium RBG_13_63_9]|nr:MAG: hypothetical protein A2Y74_08890 [Actinobacteria bacterium RBG_13_63_9]
MRTRQVSALVLVLAYALLFLSGCGGGEQATTTSLGGTVPTSPPSGPTEVDSHVGEEVSLTDTLPAKFLEAYGKRPIVVLFYVPGGTEDESVLRSLQELQSSFSDYVFLLYDYSVPDQYGDLSAVLDIEYQPQVTLIDRLGTRRQIWNGYVDKGTLNQSLVNLGRD